MMSDMPINVTRATSCHKFLTDLHNYEPSKLVKLHQNFVSANHVNHILYRLFFLAMLSDSDTLGHL